MNPTHFMFKEHPIKGQFFLGIQIVFLSHFSQVMTDLKASYLSTLGGKLSFLNSSELFLLAK